MENGNVISFRDLYDGYCRGGPLDGEKLSHPSKLYMMVVRPSHSESPQLVKFGTYTYVAGQWLWKGMR